MALRKQKQYRSGKSYLVLGTGPRVSALAYHGETTIDGKPFLLMTESSDSRPPEKWDRLRKIARQGLGSQD